jgi:hypothetical protein
VHRELLLMENIDEMKHKKYHALSLWLTPMVLGHALGLFYYLFSRSAFGIF